MGLNILTIIGTDNDLPLVRHQTIAWTSADILPTRPEEYIQMKFNLKFKKLYKQMRLLNGSHFV